MALTCRLMLLGRALVQDPENCSRIDKPLLSEHFHLCRAFGEEGVAARNPNDVSLEAGKGPAIAAEPVLEPFKLFEHHLNLLIAPGMRFHPIDALVPAIGMLVADGEIPTVRLGFLGQQGRVDIGASAQSSRVLGLYVPSVLGPEGLKAGLPGLLQIGGLGERVSKAHGCFPARRWSRHAQRPRWPGC